MKSMVFMATSCAVAAVATALWVQSASSQPRITTTRQLQVIGAAATNTAHGAWFVDLQANTVIFCERVSTGMQCHSTSIP